MSAPIEIQQDGQRPEVPGPGNDPWLRYRDTGLHVLPYRHYAIEFAALPFLAGIRQFDKVCLELPAWMPVERVRKAIADVAPGVGALLIPSGDPVPMLVQEYVGDPHPAVRIVSPSALLPIAPDAMLTVLRMAPAGAPAIEFVDADLRFEGLADEESARPFPYVDAHEVAERGLAEWYSRWKPVLLSQAPSVRDSYREAYMALRLTESVLQTGSRALFVCGALHWPRIEALLDRNSPEDLRRRLGELAPVAGQPHPRPRPGWLGAVARNLPLALPDEWFTVCSLDPALLHSLDLMDIPYVVQAFERALSTGALRVDRTRWIREMTGDCWERTGRPVSPRALATLEAFMRRRMQSDGRWSCDLDRHLLPCARNAAGASFAHELGQEAMRCDLESSGHPPEGRVVPVSGNAFLVFVNRSVHLVRLPRAENPVGEGRPFRLSHPVALTAKERMDVVCNGIMMKPPCEERLHQHLCNTARRLGHDEIPFRERDRPKPFRGNLGRGPDARRSIRAQACGDGTLFVRTRRSEPKQLTDCDACPVVWVFRQSPRIVERVTDYFADNSSEQTLFSSFFWFHERCRVGPIRISKIAWFVRLYRNVTPSWDQELVERLLIRTLPQEKFCTVRPWDDDDLPFSTDDPDLAVACAVKWSVCDHVIVVRADPSYRVGDQARGFARDRSVRLLEPDAAAFDRILLDRYALDHEVPTKGTWHPPDPVAVRMVPPVPGFGEAPGSHH